MAATHTSTTWNSKTVHVIEADLSSVDMENIGTSSVPNSPYYGVNGTFFDGSTGNLYGIAMKNGAGVRTGGTATAASCGVATKRGTLYCFSPLNGSTEVGVEQVGSYTDYSGATNSNVKWAIGGYTLLELDSPSLTESQYYTSINGVGSISDCSNAIANSENAFRFDADGLTQRTAIGYKAGKKIVLAVFQNENAYQVRQFMINQGCTMAVMLDGGGSSQMSWRNTDGSVGNYDPKGDNRSVYTMIKVTF